MKKNPLHLFIHFFVLFTILNSYSLNAQSDSLNDIFLEEGKQKLFYGDIKESLPLLEKALQLFTKQNDNLKITETYNMLSKAYNYNSQFDKALLYAEKALKNSRSKNHKDKFEEAKAFENMGDVKFSKGDLKNTEINYKLALNIRKTFFKEDNFSLAKSFFKLGTVLLAQKDLRAALDYFNKALKLKLDDSKESKILHSKINSFLGYKNYDQGNYDDALDFFEKAFNLAKEVFKDDNLFFFKIYNDFGIIFNAKEQINESLKYYQKALSISINNYGADNHEDQAMLYYNVSDIYLKQNKKSKALYHSQKSLKLVKNLFGENHRNLFFPYSQIGRIHNDENGIPYIQKALRICENADNIDYIRVSFLYDYLAEIYLNIKDYPLALVSAKKALELRVKMFGKQNMNSIRTLSNISEIYLKINDYKNAILYNEQSINFNYLGNETYKIVSKNFKPTNYLNSDLYLESLKVKGDIYLDLYLKNNTDEDLVLSNLAYKKAASLINHLRNETRNYDDKIKFSEIVKSIYEKNIKTNLLLNKLEESDSFLIESFYDSEKSRANVLRELTKNANIKKKSNIGTKVIELEKSINSEISKLTSDVIKEVTSKNKDTIKIYTLEGKILNLTRSKDSLEKRIEKDFPKYYKLKYEKNSISISEIQKKIDKTTTVIEFFSGDNSVYVFIITKDSFNVEELFIEELDTKIEHFNAYITNKEHMKYTNEASQLYNQIIKPIRKHFVGDKLIIVPDESLWHLQFDLLLTKKNKKPKAQPSYLLYDYAISYANSLSLLFEENSTESKTKLLDECIAFSYTNYKPKSDKTESITLEKLRNSKIDLPGTRKEIKELSKIFDGNYFYGENASEFNFKQNVNKYKLVHLALHADIDSLNPRNLKILFSNVLKQKKEDNKLFGHELYSLNIPADLVVLSACNTGVGKINKGEGILSLGNAFQHAGAKSLLLSRWKISDDTTPEVMKLFYTNLKNGINKSKALQKAKLDYLANSNYFTSQPFYWGSFYLLGDTNSISISKKSYNLYYYILASVLAILLFLTYLKKMR